MLAVIFRPELRTALERVGRSRISQTGIVFPSGGKIGGSAMEKTAIGAICEAAPVLSGRKLVLFDG
ncbi:MAG: hypothetical protein V8T62_09075 [Oscillospiraceae bacterium]